MRTSSLTGLDHDDLLMLRDGVEILQPDSDEAIDRQGRLMSLIVYEIERRRVHIRGDA